MKDYQLSHGEIQREQHEKKIILLADSIERPANIGGLLRTAESFGVNKVIFFNHEIQSLSSKIKRVSRSSEQYIDFEFKKDIIQDIYDLKSQGYAIYALEKTNNSIQINHLKPKNKFVVICGNEKNGIQPDVLHLVDNSVHIPIYGFTTSLNVVVATGIALHQLIQS